MKSPTLKKLIIVIFLVCLVSVPAFAQETDSAPAAAPIVDTSLQSKEVAIYGEVQSVNSQSSVLAVQYYDYDSDSEKTADILISPDTKLENVTAIGDIKKADWVDVTYVVNDGKNAAKIVTVEKEEAPASEEAVPQPPAATTTIPSEQ